MRRKNDVRIKSSIKVIGALGKTRTFDLLLNRQVLYLLSYQSMF